MTPPSSRLLTRDQHGDLESPTVSPNSAKDWRPFSSSAAMIFQSSLSISSALDGLAFLRPLYACTAREMLPAQCLLFCLNPNSCQLLGLYRSEEHTSEFQSLMRISYAVFCLKKKK